jgi:UTP-glucose-1-phosphate uridylyltransferase
MDYTVFDAIDAGFGKIVFVVSESMMHTIDQHYRHSIQNKIDFELVVQETSGRHKPWGTGHALMSAQQVVKTDFAVVNADDFYGHESLDKIKLALTNNTETNMGFLVGYPLRSTLSEGGAVSRAICKTDALGNLKVIQEHLNVLQHNNEQIISEMNSKINPLDGDLPVSLNCWAFTNDFFNQLQLHFEQFIKQHGSSPGAEFFLPEAVQQSIDNGQITVKLIPASSQWFGLTYAADKVRAEASIRKLIAQNVYPDNLWS